MSDVTDTAIDTAKTGAKIGVPVVIGALAVTTIGGLLLLKYLDEKQRAKEERRQGYKYTDVSRWFIP